MESQCSAIIMGVESECGLSAILARHFAAQGLHVYIAGRNFTTLQIVADGILSDGGKVSPVVADASQEYDIDNLFDIINFEGSTLQLAVYNVDSNIPASILETDTEVFTALWQQNCLGAFLFAKEVIECMQPNNNGSLFFTGATEILETKLPFTAAASVHTELKSFALNLAEEFSAEGIHIIHANIDSAFNSKQITPHFPGYYQEKNQQGLLTLEGIAETYWTVHQQAPSAWVHEFELKPFEMNFQDRAIKHQL
ncbi:MAG: hypothetical protein methR_P3707 [Methyloprofundus sp.]|nr:MAG: hypothetical protein methR_P3707 [Methyloprofundus sp.]